MAKEIENYNLDNILFLENSNVKQEFKDDSYVDVSETSIVKYTELDDSLLDDKVKESIVDGIKIELPFPQTCNINNSVKIEKEISTDVKIKFDNDLLFCDHCNEYYEDYCTRCGMLAHILNNITLGMTDNKAIRELPDDILEIRESSGHVGVFALKVIPESVKIGPFNGLSSSECPLRLKRGKFIVPKDKLKWLNWMQYINPAKNIFQQNLIPFKCEDNLYYHSNREILVGEELLVYFGDEYEDSVNNDAEMDFIAPTEDDVKDVFACTFCCFGFSSRVYLAKHKSACPNETKRMSSIDELTQCTVCKIHFYGAEYVERHRPYCSERNDGRSIPLALTNQTTQINACKTKRLQMYKCTQCKYKTAYEGDLKSHANKHYEIKVYRCEICQRQFKTNVSLKLHVEKIHINVEGKANQKYSMKYIMKTNTEGRTSDDYGYLQNETKQCPKCEFQTKRQHSLKYHIATRHLKEFRFHCEICAFKTNFKRNLEIHVKNKHLKEFSYECEECDYKTNMKCSLVSHMNTKHLKEFRYECEICDFKTNKKSDLEFHIKTKHLKEFRYKCEICDFKTNKKSYLEFHIKTKHLKEFRYKCEICDYKSNSKLYLEAHIKTKHLKQFSYECEECDYKTNMKCSLVTHVNALHLKEFRYECEICDFKTYMKSYLKVHIKTKHLKEFRYQCEICDYKTNRELHFISHMKTIHLAR